MPLFPAAGFETGMLQSRSALLGTVCGTGSACSRGGRENLRVERSLVCDQLEASNHNLVCGIPPAGSFVHVSSV